MALSKLAAHLPKSLLPEALEAAHQIQDKYFCAVALQGFLPRLGKLPVAFDDWMKILDVLAYQNRAQFLSSLPDSRPIAISLCDRDAFLEVLKSVQAVCKQWP